MKRNILLIPALLIVSVFGVLTAPAQITITIPKIPKIKKIKPEVQTMPEPVSTTNSQTSQTTTAQTTETAMTKPQTEDKWADSIWMQAHVEDIEKRRKEVEAYDPAEHAYLVSGSTYNYLLFAVSPRAREKWLKGANALDIRQSPNNKIDPALDALAAAAAKKLPIYIPNANNFAFHNLAEEKMMKGALDNIATLKIHKIGLYHGAWQIDKDDYGLPRARYKQGYIWVRDAADDHPYCHLYQVNIIQDYAGGGTYAASSARFIHDGLFGCPATAK